MHTCYALLCRMHAYLTKNRIIEFENLKKTYHLIYKCILYIYDIYDAYVHTHTHTLIHEK